MGIHYFIEQGPVRIAVKPFAEVQMQADTQAGVHTRVLARRRRCRPSHHETGTGYNAVLVRAHNSPVHTRALAEIVRIDNQISRVSHSQTPKSLRSRANTLSALKYSSAMALAAWLCFS